MDRVISWKLKAAILVLMFGTTGCLSAEEWLDVTPLTVDQLADSSGRQGVPLQWQFNDNQQNADVTGNTLSGNSMTGNNQISDHAFENMSGIATVIQNTGNQVVIQDSTQVNILINR